MAAPKKPKASTRAENFGANSATKLNKDSNCYDLPPPKYQAVATTSENGDTTPPPSLFGNDSVSAADSSNNNDAVIEFRPMGRQEEQGITMAAAAATPAVVQQQESWSNQLFVTCCVSGISCGDTHIRGPYMILVLVGIVVILYLLVTGGKLFIST